MAAVKSLSLPVDPGITPEFEKSPDEKYQCIHSDHVLKPPVFQLKCGHRICKECIGLLKDENQNTQISCPGSDEECLEASLQELFPDVGTNRELLRMKVFCINKAIGCKIIISWSELSKHLSVCDFVKQACPNEGCDEQFLKNELQIHVDNNCKFTKMLCEFCNVFKTKLEIEGGHKKACQTRDRPCAMSQLGCKIVGNSSQMIEHEKDLQVHMNIFATAMFGLKQHVNNQNGEIVNLKSDGQRLQEANTQLLSEISKLKESVMPRLERLEKSIAENHALVLTQDAQFTENIQTITKKQSSNNDLLMIHEGRLTTVEQKSSSARSANVESIERSIATFETKLAENDIRFKCLESTSYDGVLIWKITNFASRRREAVEGRTLSLYSQPFYTSPYGYKMCARIYLNGDGMGKNSHISLFFVVMKGEYDALLTWPFKHKVSLSLMDQLHGQKHITDVFRPDPTSTSFRMPVGDMNIASGCPMFAKLDAVNTETYVKKDTLFVKVQVTESY